MPPTPVVHEPSLWREWSPWKTWDVGHPCGLGGGQALPVSQLAGMWVNVDCPRERYTVEGMRVTRADMRGMQNFTLHWDPYSQRVQWGTQGRLWLEWLSDDFVAWVPDSQHARVWRWKRVALGQRQPCCPGATIGGTVASAFPGFATAPGPPLAQPEGPLGGFGPLQRRRASRDTAPYAALAPPRPSARWPSERAGRREGPGGGRSGGPEGHSAGGRRGRGTQSAPRSQRGGSGWGRSPGGQHRHRRGEHHPRSEDCREQDRQQHHRRRGGGQGSSAGSWRLPAEAGQALACGLTPVEVSDLLSREITPDDYEMLLRLDKDVVKKPVASADSITSLPAVSFSDAQGGSCTVCLAGFEAGDDLVALPCSHHFHRGCIARWLAECRRTCPLCSADCDISGDEMSARS